MRFEFTNHAPVSAPAAAGVCTVSLEGRPRVTSPAVAILAARQLPIMHDQSAHRLIMTIDDGYTPVKETTTPSNKLGGFRGVPPRRRPSV